MIASIRVRRGLASLAIALFWLGSVTPVSARTPGWGNSPIVPRGTTVVRPGPLNPGPLADDVVSNFRSGTYNAVTTEQPRPSTECTATLHVSFARTGPERGPRVQRSRSSIARWIRCGVIAPPIGLRFRFRPEPRSTRAQQRPSAESSGVETRSSYRRSTLDGLSVVEGSDVPRAEEWDEIHGFLSPREFERFRTWIAEALTQGALTEIPVGEPYSGSPMLDERWYRAPSGTVWRVVAPEPPFTGVFERVTR